MHSTFLFDVPLWMRPEMFKRVEDARLFATGQDIKQGTFYLLIALPLAARVLVGFDFIDVRHSMLIIHRMFPFSSKKVLGLEIK